MTERVDVHAHVAVPTPGFAERFGDERWPTLEVTGQQALLHRNGVVSRTLPAAAWSVEHRLEELSAAGIDRQVLSPVPPLICDWADTSASAEWARYINHGVAEIVAQHPEHFSGMGTVPLNHPDQAVAVLREFNDLGLVGVEIGTTAGGRELDDPDLREFFQAAGELNILVFVHPIVVDSQTGWNERIKSTEMTFGLGMTTDTAIAASRLAFGATMKSSPGLSVLLAHGGGSFAWILPRIAHLWNRTHETTAAELSKDLYVDSVVFEPANIQYLVDRLGADRILFGTDYPMPGSDSLTGNNLVSLPQTQRDMIERTNIRRFLDRDGQQPAK